MAKKKMEKETNSTLQEMIDGCNNTVKFEDAFGEPSPKADETEDADIIDFDALQDAFEEIEKADKEFNVTLQKAKTLEIFTKCFMLGYIIGIIGFICLIISKIKKNAH